MPSGLLYLEGRLKRKPRTRLKGFDYIGHYRYFVTICTRNKDRLFVDGDNVQTIISILREEAQRHAFTIWGYCFMPDHLHLLVEGDSLASDLKQFVKAFKQRTGYVCRHGAADPEKRLWQPSYYEHVLRGDEDTISVLRYILDNPVRKELAEHFLDYPYSGSFKVDLRDMFL